MADQELSAEQIWEEELQKADPETPAPEPQPEPEPAPEPQPEPDPYEGVPQALRDRLDNLEKTNVELQHHVRTAEGRVAAWQRQMQQAQNVAPSTVDIAKAGNDPDKWKALREDFPEWAEAMEEYVAAKIGSGGVNQGQITKLIEDRTAQVREEAFEAVEYVKLETRHEDWRETVNSPDFVDWIQKQPVGVYNLFSESRKAADAVKVLDLFKASKQPSAVSQIKEARKGVVSAAVTTKPGASRPSKTVDSMTPEELWNYEARRLDKQRAERGF